MLWCVTADDDREFIDEQEEETEDDDDKQTEPDEIVDEVCLLVFVESPMEISSKSYNLEGDIGRLRL